jgi:PadR family transcriptional regulator, regulatory protein PadR
MKEAKLMLVEGTLYPLLTRLRKLGILNYRWEESDSGPPRKYYSLTDEGKKLVEELSKSWEELKNAVEKIETLK